MLNNYCYFENLKKKQQQEIEIRKNINSIKIII